MNKKGKVVIEFENKAKYKRIEDTVHTGKRRRSTWRRGTSNHGTGEY